MVAPLAAAACMGISFSPYLLPTPCIAVIAKGPAAGSSRSLAHTDRTALAPSHPNAATAPGTHAAVCGESNRAAAARSCATPQLPSPPAASRHHPPAPAAPLPEWQAAWT